MFENDIKEKLMHDCRRFPSFRNEKSICFECGRKYYCKKSDLNHIILQNKENKCPDFVHKNSSDEFGEYFVEDFWNFSQFERNSFEFGLNNSNEIVFWLCIKNIFFYIIINNIIIFIFLYYIILY